MGYLETCFAGAALAIAILCGGLSSKPSGAPEDKRRQLPLDGLRGLLAFFVFLHHSAIWYFYLHVTEWTYPPSNLFRHFGASSVATFFMITGFLFFGKVTGSSGNNLNWTTLYLNRAARILPLYAVAGLVEFSIFNLAGDHPPSLTIISMLTNSFRWFASSYYIAPDAIREINGLNADLSMAFVRWSLEYEWYMYFSLPIFAWLYAKRPPLFAMVIAASGLVQLFVHDAGFGHTPYFLIGIVASLACRRPRFRQFSANPIAGLLIAACAASAVVLTFVPWGDLFAMVMLGTAFSLIAGGNTLFGLLNLRGLRKLGDVSFSIYLLHGFVLFVVFDLLIGLPAASRMSMVEFWSIILATVPALVVLCNFTYRWIELPGIAFGRALEQRLSTPRDHEMTTRAAGVG